MSLGPSSASPAPTWWTRSSIATNGRASCCAAPPGRRCSEPGSKRYFDNCPAADAAEQAREKVEQRKLPAVFAPQSRHRAIDDGHLIGASRFSLCVVAPDVAARVARREPNAISHSEAFHFGRGAVGERVELAIVGGNPQRCSHAVAVAAKCDQTHISLRCQ